AKDHPEIQKRWLRTGLTELDNLLFRLDPGLMTIVAARPGDGKTVLTLQLCDWLDRCGTATAFISLEMPEEQMLLRLATTKTEIPMWKIRTGDLSDQELLRVYDEAARYGSGECRLHLDHIKGKKTPFEVRRRLRYFKREFDIKLAVVDYVQLLTATGRKWGTRNEELTFISSFLMETASELGIHLIDVSQMSRPEKGKPDREPQLEDLRDCGGLEQDANNVIFIWHPYRATRDKIEFPDNYAHIILRKQRQGPTGRVKLYWDCERVRFTSMMEALPV
ncbi:MAG: DnaB-like helicase C-terminal domain-containing protein, partial [Candidatus Zixiibacteriota bacterium]